MGIRNLEKASEILVKNKMTVNDPWDLVDGFEKLISNFCGSKYAVALDSCTNGLFLSLYYKNIRKQISRYHLKHIYLFHSQS